MIYILIHIALKFAETEEVLSDNWMKYQRVSTAYLTDKLMISYG
jgi:hypothetical protein